MDNETKAFIEEMTLGIGLIVILLVVILLTGCCPAKVATNNAIYDSVVVRTVHKTEIVKDTIPYYIPAEREVITTKDTISYLENRWAYTEAVVSDGMLTHSLGIKDEPHKIVVDKVIEYRDTTIYKEVIKEIERIVEVEKPETWLEKTQKITFWAMLSALVLYILWRRLKSKISIFK